MIKSFIIHFCLSSRLLIEFVVESRIELWKGYLYAIIMTLTAMIQTIFLSQYNQKIFVIGMRIRTVLVSNIYRKVSIVALINHEQKNIFKHLFCTFRPSKYPTAHAKNRLSVKLSTWCQSMPSDCKILLFTLIYSGRLLYKLDCRFISCTIF